MPQQLLLLLPQKDPDQDLPGVEDCFEIGTIGRVLNAIKLTSGDYAVIVEGLQRARVTRWIQESPGVVAEIEPVLLAANDGAVGDEVERCMRLMGAIGADAAPGISSVVVPGLLADIAAPLLDSAGHGLFQVLDGADRLRQVNALLGACVESRTPKDEPPS